MAPEDNPADEDPAMALPTKEEWDAAYPDHVHDWFGLSYAQFLTLPRLLMQAMPPAWQKTMVGLLNELDDAFEVGPENGTYWVNVRNERGQNQSVDPNICDYRHGKAERFRKAKHA